MLVDIPKELSRGEKTYIEENIPDPVWIQWVKKTNDRLTVQLRLLVVSKHRIYSIKRNRMGKKQIVREGHLFSLREIYSDDIDNVTLVFPGFKLVANGPQLGVELPKVLVQSFYNISFGFPAPLCPKVILEPHGRTYPTADISVPVLAGGFLEVYQAHCDFYGMTPSPDVIKYVEDAVAIDSRRFNFDDIVGISKESDYSFQLTPVVATLRTNTYFTSICMHEKTRKEAIAGLADIMSYNYTITTVDFSGIEADDGWVALGEALKLNPSNSVLELSLGDNSVGEKGAPALSMGLSCVDHPLTSLSLPNLGLNSKITPVVIKTLGQSLGSVNSLQEVDLSGNQLLKEGTVLMAEWFSRLQPQPGVEINGIPRKHMRRIKLANAVFDSAAFFGAATTHLFSSLEHIDISGNKFDEHLTLLNFLTKTVTLQSINLSNCSLNGTQLALLFTTISQNLSVNNIELDISGNDMSKEENINGLCRALPTAVNIATLKIRDMGIKREHLAFLLKSIGDNPGLTSVDVSGNFKHGSPAKEAIIDALVACIKSSKLVELVVEGIKDNHLGKDALVFLKHLATDTKLQRLNIKHNHFGDDGARELFDSLCYNKTLQHIEYDGNNITIPGFLALRRCVNYNRTLVSMTYPEKDLLKAVSGGKEKVKVHQMLRELLDEVAIYCTNNRLNSPDGRPLQVPPIPEKITLDINLTTTQNSLNILKANAERNTTYRYVSHDFIKAYTDRYGYAPDFSDPVLHTRATSVRATTMAPLKESPLPPAPAAVSYDAYGNPRETVYNIRPTSVYVDAPPPQQQQDYYAAPPTQQAYDPRARPQSVYKTLPKLPPTPGGAPQPPQDYNSPGRAYSVYGAPPQQPQQPPPQQYQQQQQQQQQQQYQQQQYATLPRPPTAKLPPTPPTPAPAPGAPSPVMPPPSFSTPPLGPPPSFSTPPLSSTPTPLNNSQTVRHSVYAKQLPPPPPGGAPPTLSAPPTLAPPPSLSTPPVLAAPPPIMYAPPPAALDVPPPASYAQPDGSYDPNAYANEEPQYQEAYAYNYDGANYDNSAGYDEHQQQQYSHEHAAYDTPAPSYDTPAYDYNQPPTHYDEDGIGNIVDEEGTQWEEQNM